MGDFVDTPMSKEFVKTETPQGGPGTYDGDDCAGFSEYRRTKSSNGVREKIKDGSVPNPSGEPDQF